MRISEVIFLGLSALNTVPASPALPVDHEGEVTTTIHLISTSTNVVTIPAVATHTAAGGSHDSTCGVYVCINRFWEEPCQHLFPKTGECFAFMGWWNQSLSALGPDPDCFCAFYSDDKCSNHIKFANGTTVTLRTPGIDDGLAYEGVNDSVGSMRCVYDS
ncbi:hypothetical protein LTR84_002980 [Exophiala bonariae]|uniref:Uncharacterized protein n=1 Tax=Exophiala bonariae TaxID=1690606 RepID=A0AAV9N8D6_9EURO|nr:hypothetical protein LTR84_002980 [Exophiala bonariae]